MTHGIGPELTVEELRRVGDPILFRHSHMLVFDRKDGEVVATFLWHFATAEVVQAFADEVKRRWPEAQVMAGDHRAWICVTDGRPKDQPVWLEPRGTT